MNVLECLDQLYVSVLASVSSLNSNLLFCLSKKAAVSNVNCRIQWIIEFSMNANCTPRVSLGVGLSECRAKNPLLVVVDVSSQCTISITMQDFKRYFVMIVLSLLWLLCVYCIASITDYLNLTNWWKTVLDGFLIWQNDLLLYCLYLIIIIRELKYWQITIVKIIISLVNNTRYTACMMCVRDRLL